jgi:hypothetical protein
MGNSMSTAEFEIRRDNGGFRVFAHVTWGQSTRAGGLASSEMFPSLKHAMSWVGEQFEIPAASWHRISNGNLSARKETPTSDKPSKSSASASSPVRRLVLRPEQQLARQNGTTRVALDENGQRWVNTPTRHPPYYACSAGVIHPRWWRREAANAGEVFRCEEHELAFAS